MVNQLRLLTDAAGNSCCLALIPYAEVISHFTNSREIVLLYLLAELAPITLENKEGKRN